MFIRPAGWPSILHLYKNINVGRYTQTFLTNFLVTGMAWLGFTLLPPILNVNTIIT